jgi:hypothetical protein
VLPFISILGYDIFDPTEVVPEFTADVGIKKGEKVDYAIVRDGKVIMLFEAKKCGTPLNSTYESQLYRYFSVAGARIAVLTDGILYQFYTDLDEPNKMDKKPFMEFNLLDIQEPLVTELKRLSKESFNIEEILSTADDLKYTREIKRILGEQLSTPSDEFVRCFATQIYSGKLRQSVREKFSEITKRALNQFINERINERLKSAMMDSPGQAPQGSAPQEVQSTPIEVSEPRDQIVTTGEEMEGYYIVKAILREAVDPGRIAHRDTRSYFGILLDDNARKPICRLYFDRKQKYIGLFDANKQEQRTPIEELDDIYKFADQLKGTALLYDKKET